MFRSRARAEGLGGLRRIWHFFVCFFLSAACRRLRGAPEDMTFLFCMYLFSPRCVQKASGAPEDMAAAARCMNEYLDMFPQV